MDVSDIFIFFCSGSGKGAPGRGCRFSIENPTRGEGFSRTAGAEGPGGCLRRNGDFFCFYFVFFFSRAQFFFWGGGGGGSFFCSGPKCPPRKEILDNVKCPTVTFGTAIYRSPEALWARNPEEVSERSSRASPLGVLKKCRKRPPNTAFDTFLTLSWVLWDFFDTFLTLRAGRLGKTFLRLLGVFGPRRPWDSCVVLKIQRIAPPCPTHQLWPFSSAKENHLKMPLSDPRNEFPWSSLDWPFFGIIIFFSGKA